MSKISLYGLSSSYVSGLRDLYEKVFRKQVEEEYFSIKYGLKSKGKRQFSTVAFFEGKVIGFMGAIEQKFLKKEKEIILVATCDYILLKEFRGKGIFNLIYDHTLKLIGESNALGAYAFQSDQTHKVTAKLGWVKEKGFSRFHVKVYPISTSRFLRVMKLDNWRKARLNYFLEAYSATFDFNQVKSPDTYEQLYDQNFRSQKAFCKRYLVRISSCVMWLKYDYVLTVGFCHFEQDAKPRKMIRTLKKIARWCGIHEIVFQVHSICAEAQVLRQFLEEKPSFKIDSLSFDDQFDFGEIKLNFMDMDIF